MHVLQHKVPLKALTPWVGANQGPVVALRSVWGSVLI